MLDACTTGVQRASTAAIARLFSTHAPRGTGTQVAAGQRRTAREIGIPLRTP